MPPLNDRRSARLRRVCFCVAVAAAAWGTIAWLTGGVSFSAGPLRISSRNPRNPFLVAVLGAALAWTSGPAGRRTAVFLDECRWAFTLARAGAVRAWTSWTRVETFLAARTPAYVAPLLAVAIACFVVLLGFKFGAFVAAAADASGYVSHAEIWATKTFRVEPPLMRELTTQIPPDVFAPLAYRPGMDGTSIVPVTAPGLPIVMAMFQTSAGPRAIYWVVPLMAGLAVVATYLLGATFGRWIGVVAAVLLALSPSFLFQLTSSPMSDIPGATWWALSLAFVMRPGRSPALVAGLSAGAAILTRPNLLPLAVIPALWMVREMWRERTPAGIAAQRAVCFVAGLVPACLGIALLFNFWYGSPLSSGYGNLDVLYAWRHVASNLARYPRWLLESQTPLVALAAVAPLLVGRGIRDPASRSEATSRAFILLVFVLAVFGCYVLYLPFEAWWFLRFLLPAYPPLLVLTGAALVAITTRVLPGLRVTVVTLVLAAVAWHCVQYARVANAFNVGGAWKFEEAGLYVASHVPERAAILASQHSGSVRHYARRPTLFFDRIPGDKLDWVVSELQRLGYGSYLLLEDWEEESFRRRFPGQQAVDALSTTPVAELTGGKVPIYSVRLYELMHNGALDAPRR